MQSKQKFCKRCDRSVLAHKQDSKIGCFAHMVHAFFTVCTGCLWGIVWVLHANYDGEKFKCSVCGGVTK